MLEVAYEHVAVGVQGESQAEAARRSDELQSHAVRVDPIDLPQLPAAPHATVWVDCDALGVVEARLSGSAVVEHAACGEVQEGHSSQSSPESSPGVMDGLRLTPGSAQLWLGTRANHPGRPGSRSYG